MINVSQRHLDEFVTACRKTADFGLLRCSSGNMSWRVDDDLMLVTATRTWLGEITADQISYVRISDGKVLNDRQPSVESLFHVGVLQKRNDVNVVLHFQSPSATVLACGDPGRINFNVIFEVPYYIGDVAIIPTIEPGSNDLAKAVITSITDHDMVILRNHGFVTVGTDLNDAIQKAAFFELACEVILRGGESIVPIAPKLATQIRENAVNKTGV